MTDHHARWIRVVAGIQPPEDRWIDGAHRRLLHLTKPRGSLGRLEDLAAQLCGIQQTLRPHVSNRLIIVCASDHGVAAEGVSAFPSSVTAQMVANFATGGAAINALAQAAGARVRVIDVGVHGPLVADGPGAEIVRARVRDGSGNIAREPAMSEPELWEAVAVGLDQADRAAAEGVDLLGIGEMGIGNSTPASALTAALTGLETARVTGRGTGIDDAALAHKRAVLERVLTRHHPRADRPLEALGLVGGLEIAALCGLVAGGAASRLPIVIDGFIATSAALVAVAACPEIRHYLFAGHRSTEPGHVVQLEHLGLQPLLDLEMRLGEGTGAALAMSVLGAACAAFNGMATFESAGVSGAPC